MTIKKSPKIKKITPVVKDTAEDFDKLRNFIIFKAETQLKNISRPDNAMDVRQMVLDSGLYDNIANGTKESIDLQKNTLDTVIKMGKGFTYEDFMVEEYEDKLWDLVKTDFNTEKELFTNYIEYTILKIYGEQFRSLHAQCRAGVLNQMTQETSLGLTPR